MTHAPTDQVTAAPWLKLFPKQFDVLNVGITPPAPGDVDIKPRVLLSGGRMTGKTIAIVHRIMRHLWETPGARVAVFTTTMKVAKDGGVWEDILDGVREWIAAGAYNPANGAVFEFTTRSSDKTPGPKIDSTTRTSMFKVRNFYGGESELKLFSLEHDHEVTAKVKGTRFSMMWFSELSNFGDASVMNVSYLQLRMKHLKPWQHLWIADTNPHEDGDEHWIYKTWYKQRLQDADSIRIEVEKKVKDPEKVTLAVRQKLEFRKSLKLIEIFLDDNIFLAEGERIALTEQYDGDIGEYERNVEGKWVKGHGNIGKHFADVFSEDIHVVGSEDPNVGTAIDLDPMTMDIINGWDLGDINHAYHMLEKRVPVYDPNISDSDNRLAIWCVLDEHVIIGERTTIAEFAIDVLEKRQKLESHYRRAFQWIDWADSSSTDVWRASGEGGSQAVEVEAVSGGAIQLQGVSKPKYSVKARVRLIRFLLRKQRIFVAKHCVKTIEMFYHLSKGTKQDEYVMENQYKHPFDSLSYPIYMETMKDPESMFLLSNKPKLRSSGVTFVPGIVRV
jgi:hypothetical protein